MKLKYLAVVAAVALSTPAAAASVNGDYTSGSGSSFTISNWATLTSGTTYNFALSIASTFSSFGFAGISASLIDSSTGSVFQVLNTGTSSASASASINSVFAAAANGTYNLKIAGGSFGGDSTFTASLNTVSVPGPEAGAGLGALAMGGLAFWMNRRRKESVTA